MLAFSPVLVALAGPAAAATPLSVQTSGDGLSVSAHLGDCTAQLTRPAASETFTYANSCRQDLAGRVSLLVAMLEAALPQPADRATGASVRVASLEQVFPDFARRLANAASRSPEWHGERARRDQGFAQRTLLRIANLPPIYRELQEAARPLRFAVRISAMEAAQIGTPAETPFPEWLADRGVDTRRLVPFDAATTFRFATE
jgi:hypothetical protein